MKRPALFLDRDGVINKDHGYVHSPKDFEFIDGIFDLVTTANSNGYLVVVVTNQAGIGRGYYSEQKFHILTKWMKSKFIEHGARIDAVYYCPYHPHEAIGIYRRASEFRKPAPGMLFQAERELDINLKESVMVGDTWRDEQAAISAGIDQIFILGSVDETNSYTRKIKFISNVRLVIPYINGASNRS